MKHRSFLYASLLLVLLSVAGCGGGGGGGGGDGGGETSTPTATPTPTAVGVATGDAVSATIGAAGGSVSTPDGKIVLTVPAGALAADTVISIQPLTNMAHGKIGAAYRLTPEGQTFLTPVTLTFAYTDEDLDGTAADFLGAAFQTADGFWQWAGDATVDTTAKTVSVTSSHFSDWSHVRGLQIRPPKKTVEPNGSVGLQVKVCYPVSYDDGLGSLSSDCDATGQGIVATLSINEWSVNGVPGGVPDRPDRRSVFGTVQGSGATATYMAPATEPIPNTVAVSARVHIPKKGSAATTLVVSNITVGGAGWSGTVSWTLTGSETVTSATSNPLTVDTYKVSGSGTVTLKPTAFEGVLAFESGRATYSRQADQDYTNTFEFGGCRHSVVQQRRETRSGTATDISVLVAYLLPGSDGVSLQLIMSIPAGPTIGHETVDATETVSGPNSDCRSPAPTHTDHPLNGTMPADTFFLDVTGSATQLNGSATVRLGGLPEREYAVSYSLSR